MTARLILLLVVLVQMLDAGRAPAGTASIAGSWKVAVTFVNGESRSLRFEAVESGKGSFALSVPGPTQTAGTDPATGSWSRSGDVVIFSGPIQFPLGNVGLERGTLVLRGKVASDGSIGGAASFFSADQEPRGAGARPAKSGTFTAGRVGSN